MAISTSRPPVIAASQSDRFLDRLFGYDYFISYAHKDGLEYPVRLAELLTATGYSVFLDQTEFAVGDELDAETRRRIRMSSYLIVLAGPAAVESEWVQKEVEQFLDTGRTPIVVKLPDLPDQTLAENEVFSPNWIRHTESDRSAPSRGTIEALTRAFKRHRRDIVRKRFLASALVVLAATIGFGSYFWFASQREQHLKEIAAAEAYTTQAREALGRREYQSAALLALAATNVRSDRETTGAQRRILSEAAMIYFGTTIAIGEANAGRPRAVEFSPDESMLAIADNDGRIKIVRSHDGSSVSDVDMSELEYDGVSLGATVTALATSPEALLLAGDDRGRLHWFDWKKLEHFRFVDAHEGPVWDISISHDSAKIATGGEDNVVQIWDTANGRDMGALKEFASKFVGDDPNRVSAISYSPAGNLLAVASQDNTVQVVDFAAEKIVADLDAFPEEGQLGGGWSHYVGAVEWHPSGTLISTGSVDGHLRHWPILDGAPDLSSSVLMAQRVNMKRLLHFQYLAASRYVAGAYDTGDLLIFDTQTGSIVFELAGSLHWTEDLRVSPSGALLAVASGDGLVWVWDLAAVSEPNLVNRLCERLATYGVDVEEEWRNLSSTIKSATAPPRVCDADHRSRVVDPFLMLSPEKR